jgi:hypothetical protein
MVDDGQTAVLNAEEAAMASSVFFFVPDAEMEVFLFPASVGSEGSGSGAHHLARSTPSTATPT